MGSGGKRKGAGRKADRGEVKEPRTVKLTPTLLAFLDAQEESSAELIEDALRKTKRFREWSRSRK